MPPVYSAPHLPLSALGSFRYLITDMDGVLWRGQAPLPGLAEFIRFLRDRSIKFVCATNNASTLAEKLAGRLHGWGADVEPDEIVTSSTATADYLATILPPGSRLYVIGLEGLRVPLLERGFEFAVRDVAAVVVGIDWNVTYQQLKQAALLIRAGAKFIGTNGDRTFPTPEGIVPGNGALLAFLEAATDVPPIVMGKPEPVLYEMALKRLNAVPDQTLVLGDRLETDILGAARLNLKSALVLSGVTTRAELAASDYQPDWVFDDIADLTRQWAMTNDQCRMQDAGCRMQDAGCKMQDARCKMQDARCKMQDARCKMQDAGCRMQDAQLSIDYLTT